jgi:hypothetical protein
MEIWGKRTARAGHPLISATRVRFIRPRRTISLYSWKPSDQPWHFVAREEPRDRRGWVRLVPLHNDREVTHASHQIIGVDSLKSYIASLPALTSVPWGNNPPGNIVTYPDYHIRDDIMAFGEKHHVFIHVLPSVYDP